MPCAGCWIKYPDVGLDDLGAAVRLQLDQPDVARPGQRLSELAHGSRFPTATELDAILQRLVGSAAGSSSSAAWPPATPSAQPYFRAEIIIVAIVFRLRTDLQDTP
jgi:hypothetical protein